jgi:hypothetical protein
VLSIKPFPCLPPSSAIQKAKETGVSNSEILGGILFIPLR